MLRGNKWLAVIACAMITSSLAHDAAVAQNERSVLTETSKDPVVISGQLRAGLELTQLALAHFQRPDAVEIFATCYEITYRAYAMIRVLVSSLSFAQRESRSPDPMLALQLKYTDQAWGLIRRVTDSHYGSAGIHVSPEQIPRDIENLSEAIKILRRVATTMP